jgi:hypothetical protein
VGPLRSRVWWLGKRLLLLAPLVAWAAAGGPFLAPLMWAVTGYLVFRAWPGLVEDWRSVRRLLGLGKAIRSTARRGEF